MLPLALSLLKNKSGSPSAPANPKNVKLIIGGIFALVLGTVGFFWWRNKKAQAQAALLQNDVFTQQASALRNAMDGPGTNEKLIFDTIPLITDFSKVAAAYKNLTKGGNLEKDLSDELSAEDYQKVMALLQYKGRTKGNTGAGASSNVFIADTPGIKDWPIGTDITLNWNGKRGLVAQIFGYLDIMRYPSSPIVFKRPADYQKIQKFGKIKGFKEVTYGTGKTKVIVVQVVANNGQNWWFRQFDLAKFIVAAPKVPTRPTIINMKPKKVNGLEVFFAN